MTAVLRRSLDACVSWFLAGALVLAFVMAACGALVPAAVVFALFLLVGGIAVYDGARGLADEADRT